MKFDKDIFTTGEAATLCRLSQRTIIRCFDNGLLPGFRVPGSNFRRILRDDLLRFIKAHGLPMDDAIATNTLLVSQDQGLIENMMQASLPAHLYQLVLAGSNFEAGLRVAKQRPNCVVIDFSHGAENALRLCQSLRSDQKLAAIPLVVILSYPGELKELEKWGPDDVFVRPFDASLLALRLRELAQARH